MRPHLHLLCDLRWFAVRCGLGYYDVNNDALRPAFIEFTLFERWRVTFEACRIDRIRTWR